MRTAAIGELKNRLSHFLRRVSRGEPVTILDRGRPVAMLMPILAVEDSLQRLASQGLARPPSRRLPAGFFQDSLPRSQRSVTAALIEDREGR